MPTAAAECGSGDATCHDYALLVSCPDPDSLHHLSRSGDVIHPQLWESGSGYETNALLRGFHVRASFLPVETHCEDGGWIQPGLNLFSFSAAIKPLVN